MRIGIDAREIGGRATGVGRYLHGLLREWATANYAQRHEFLLYADEPPAAELDARRFPVRIVPGPAGTWWEQVRLPAFAQRDHLDVLFSPGYTAPVFHRMPSVVAIHDISFAAHPEWFSTREGLRRRWLARRSATRALAVITISEFSKREIVDRFGIVEDRVRVIPPGITRVGRASDPNASPRVLYVGSIFNRRHVPDLIRAFGPVARAHADAVLDLVGDNRSHPFEDLTQVIEREGLADRVRWRRFLPDDELGELYASARAFAFLSEYEGLGLTPLEALAAGVPPVLTDTPVARESCGDAALYVPPGDLASATRALERLLFDEPTRTALLDAAPAVVGRYRWAQAARATLAVIEESA